RAPQAVGPARRSAALCRVQLPVVARPDPESRLARRAVSGAALPRHAVRAVRHRTTTLGEEPPTGRDRLAAASESPHSPTTPRQTRSTPNKGSAPMPVSPAPFPITEREAEHIGTVRELATDVAAQAAERDDKAELPR